MCAMNKPTELLPERRRATGTQRPGEYGIDELARAAGTTVRNVRAYQDRGLIAPPARRGRAGVYTNVHLARLRVIGDLLSRGYTLSNIAELLEAWENGWELQRVIGVETVLASPWADEAAMKIAREDIPALLGAEISAEEFRKLVELGYVVNEGDYLRIPSPRLFHAAAGIIRAGVPLSKLLGLADPMREEIGRIAEAISLMVVQSLIDPYGKDRLPPAEELPRLTEAARSLRPLAETFVSAELDHALEQAATRLLGDRLIAALAPGLGGGASRDAGEPPAPTPAKRKPPGKPPEKAKQPRPAKAASPKTAAPKGKAAPAKPAPAGKPRGR